MKYSNQTRILVAVDCIIFGFDGTDYKLLLIQRGFAPEKEKWSLMGGFIQPEESADEAAERILKQLTGLHDVYMEQIQAFSKPERDPIERVIALPYVALIDIKKYQAQINDDFHARWFSIKELPKLIFDHQAMVELALSKLRYKAAFHPILFELLPDKFTLPQLQAMYEGLYDTKIDKRNFTRKILSTNLLKKEKEKDKSSSKKGAFFYSLDEANYKENFSNFHNFIPKNEIPVGSE
ncbi:NUDIX hydrolase [Cecembia calidifontis]|jgi:ADP-ribose pyrophosphatase YjhB (NUDIX family)|uniref:ADP-ribose pyrophosphatase YjhB (NUDIX family) n=1 Tax=Cecembia calidifontis TaxID=1187080 RepID=A0A4Q7PC21_9BACT|nr:NUDIX hydrolase [Cecembia calidifontis]RZS97831.1 ADP-ribose pyrophosphatase YjhB (NUDIX family) [Cecembia calidifontis]